MLFVLHLLEIPTQSVVHREFCGELPGVLRVKPALHAVKPLNVVVPDTCATQLAESEAGETITEACLHKGFGPRRTVQMSDRHRSRKIRPTGRCECRTS